MTRMVNCVKLGREAEGLKAPTYPGALGKRIYENVSAEGWKAWVQHQTMLINENRLNMTDAKARQPATPLASRDTADTMEALGLGKHVAALAVQ